MLEATFTWASLAPAVAELYLAAAICALLMVDVFFLQRRPALTATFALLILTGGAALTAHYGAVDTRITIFSGMYVADPLAHALKLCAFLFTAFVVLYSRSYMQLRGLLKGEYFVLLLTALLGVFVLISANSLLTVYIGVELLALSVYALVAFDRDSSIAAEAAMKYFVLGAIASGTMLYGMSMIYGMTGTLSLEVLATTLFNGGQPLSLGIILGLVFLVVAVAFKLGAVPFHMWLPDVYHGAPTSVTLFIGTLPKIGYFALMYRLLAEGLQGASVQWGQMFAVLAVATLLLGNLVALAQTNLKRMLAYSTIANIGFIMLGFVTGTASGYSAALYYTLVYVWVALGSFAVILLASSKGFEADELHHYKGLHARDPLLALGMLMLMFSTAGVPPFVGFWAKLRIFEELWAVGHTGLVLFAAAVSVIGAFYYLRIVKLMYFDTAEELPVPPRGFAVRVAFSLNIAIVLIFGLLPGPFLELCARLIS
jgi:NADH-quinone oxidoreductase subunit N